MEKILQPQEAIDVCETIRVNDKKIILIGGCFDILHVGHIAFLTQAKKQGDILLILLESDAHIAKRKGNKRPINLQADRALVLSSLHMVDYVVCLSEMPNDAYYDELIFALKPAIIATTKGDTSRVHKERQAKKLGIPLIDVVQRVKNQSTSRVSALLQKEI